MTNFVAVWSFSALLVASLSTSTVLLFNKEAIDIIITFENEWSKDLKRCTDSYYLMMAMNKKIECSDVFLMFVFLTMLLPLLRYLEHPPRG